MSPVSHPRYYKHHNGGLRKDEREEKHPTNLPLGVVTKPQCGPLSLVEAQGGSALIGRELHSVAPPVSLMP